MIQINPLSDSSPSLQNHLSTSIPTLAPTQRTSKNRPSKSAYRRFMAESALVKTAPLPIGGKYVGELKEKWTYPSDHPAIGFTVDGDMNVMSWNVLDSHYMSWVTEKDSQGLNGSQITDENYLLEGTNITRREQHIIELIIQSLSSPNASKEIVNLQECSGNFMKELKKQLPENYGVLFDHGNAILYDKSQLTLVSSQALPIFSEDVRTIQHATFERNGQTMHVINGHLPGNPIGPAPKEFARYLMSQVPSSEICIAMGDINFNEIEMDQAFNAVAQELGIQNAFLRNTPYPSNINPRTNPDPLTSKAIDHAFYRGVSLEALPADDVIAGTQVIVDLLS